MIKENNAHRYCKDDISKIENYDKAIADNTQTWEIHHRTEIWWNCSAKELIENDCYYHRPAKELIFLTKAEHRRLHHKGKTCAPFTAEHRRKLSDAKKGKYLSTEIRQKMAAAKKGTHHSEETRKKISEARKAYLERHRQGGNA